MNKNLLQLLYLSSIIYFCQGIEAAPNLSIFFYFKELLHLSPSTIMYIGAIIGIAWLIKPLIGFFVDNFKWSKKQWILIATMLSAIICLLLGLLPTLSLIPLVICMILANLATASRDVSNDGMMAIEAKKSNSANKIQSVQWISVTLASILTGVGGGYLASHYNYQIAYLLLLPFYGLLLWQIYQYKDKTPVINKQNPLLIIKKLLLDKNLLWICAFIFLFNFSPSFGTPITFIMVDNFHFSKQFIGWLSTIGAVCSIIGALLFYKFGQKLNIKKGLTISVILGALTSLCYLYLTPVSCVIYSTINSVIGMFIHLLLLSFLATNTKNKMESISFALFCSVVNLASTTNSITGGFLYPKIGLTWLIIIASFTSFMCLPILKRIRF